MLASLRCIFSLKAVETFFPRGLVDFRSGKDANRLVHKSTSGGSPGVLEPALSTIVSNLARNESR